MISHVKTLGLALAVSLTAGAAVADYPERAVTIVVPFSAGGNTDTIARIAAEHLSQELGQPVVVENRKGAGGTIGAAQTVVVQGTASNTTVSVDTSLVNNGSLVLETSGAGFTFLNAPADTVVNNGTVTVGPSRTKSSASASSL